MEVGKNMEIERKFLLSSLPGVGKAVEIDHSYLKQVYVSIEPEVRVREKRYPNTGKCQYMLTVKGNGDLSRFECETEVTKEFFESIKDFIGKEPITKLHLNYEYKDGLIIEVSVVDDGKFIYGEVEFTSEEQADKFVWPWSEILIKEITYDSSYKMKNYWKSTRM